MTGTERHPDLDGFDALIGDWTIEATHRAFPSVVVHGESTFEWLEGGHFLIQRSRNEHPDFPDALAMFGAFDGVLLMHYYDSRGVYRVYQTSMRDGVWRISRDVPGFAQRFTGTLADDGQTLVGLFELCEDGSTWADDLAITYRRRNA
jgi:hypothetical protein